MTSHTTTRHRARLRWAAVAAVLAAATLAGCSPTAPPGGGGGSGGPTTWTIPAGAHESTGSTVSFSTTDAIEFTARFDASAEYATSDPSNQLDINKLRGRSDCDSHHHTNSARFGWRWNTDRVEILAYTYVGGVRSWALLGSVQPGDWHSYRLEFTPTGYEFSLDGTTTTVPRGCAGTGLLRYELWPYFGGDGREPLVGTGQEVAPVDGPEP